jgi:hypothetical protein
MQETPKSLHHYQPSVQYPQSNDYYSEPQGQIKYEQKNTPYGGFNTNIKQGEWNIPRNSYQVAALYSQERHSITNTAPVEQRRKIKSLN